MKGTFYGIGVGPGDPELLTMKAVKAIQKVDIIIAPKTEKKDGSVALNIARPYLKEDVRIVYQVFPMVKGFALDDAAWKQNKEEILGFLEEGKNVAFLTLGDAMFFSTYIYVFRLLDNVVLMKVYKNFPEVAELLEKNAMLDHAVMVSRCGLPDEERIDDIRARKNQPVNYLSTILARRSPEK